MTKKIQSYLTNLANFYNILLIYLTKFKYGYILKAVNFEKENHREKNNY